MGKSDKGKMIRQQAKNLAKSNKDNKAAKEVEEKLEEKAKWEDIRKHEE